MPVPIIRRLLPHLTRFAISRDREDDRNTAGASSASMTSKMISSVNVSARRFCAGMVPIYPGVFGYAHTFPLPPTSRSFAAFLAGAALSIGTVEKTGVEVTAATGDDGTSATGLMA